MTANLASSDSQSKLFSSSAFQSAIQPIQVITIYPNDALALLQSTDESIQRKIKRPQVRFLKKQLEEGKWVVDGNTIKIDKHGNVIDGRHRLTACAESGIPLTTYVVKGLDTDVIKTLDRGIATRTLSDVLAIDSGITHKYTNAVVSVANFCYSFDSGNYGMAGSQNAATTGNNRAMALDAVDFLNWIKNNPEIFQFTADAMNVRAPGDKLVDPKLFCGLYWLLKKRETGFGLLLPQSQYSHLVDKFFAGISTGVGYDEKSVIFKLRNRLMNHYGKGKNKDRNALTPSQLVWLLVKAWEFFCTNKTVTKWEIPSKVTELPKIL